MVIGVACVLLGLVQVFLSFATSADNWQSALVFKFVPFLAGVLLWYLGLKGFGVLP